MCDGVRNNVGNPQYGSHNNYVDNGDQGDGSVDASDVTGSGDNDGTDPTIQVSSTDTTTTDATDTRRRGHHHHHHKQTDGDNGGKKTWQSDNVDAVSYRGGNHRRDTIGTPVNNDPVDTGDGEVDDTGDDTSTGSTSGTSGTGGVQQPTTTNPAYIPTGVPEVDRWADDIVAASKATGVPVAKITAMVYAESSGDPTTVSTNPEAGDKDVGLTQISDKRYNGGYDENDGGVAAAQKKNGAPAHLDVNDPAQNILAGAWELRNWYEVKSGQTLVNGGTDANWLKAHKGYVGDNLSGSSGYANAVMLMTSDIQSGRGLDDANREQRYGGF